MLRIAPLLLLVSAFVSLIFPIRLADAGIVFGTHGRFETLRKRQNACMLFVDGFDGIRAIDGGDIDSIDGNFLAVKNIFDRLEPLNHGIFGFFIGDGFRRLGLRRRQLGIFDDIANQFGKIELDAVLGLSFIVSLSALFVNIGCITGFFSHGIVTGFIGNFGSFGFGIFAGVGHRGSLRCEDVTKKRAKERLSHAANQRRQDFGSMFLDELAVDSDHPLAIFIDRIVAFVELGISEALELFGHDIFDVDLFLDTAPLKTLDSKIDDLGSIARGLNRKSDSRINLDTGLHTLCVARFFLFNNSLTRLVPGLLPIVPGLSLSFSRSLLNGPDDLINLGTQRRKLGTQVAEGRFDIRDDFLKSNGRIGFWRSMKRDDIGQGFALRRRGFVNFLLRLDLCRCHLLRLCVVGSILILIGIFADIVSFIVVTEHR